MKIKYVIIICTCIILISGCGTRAADNQSPVTVLSTVTPELITEPSVTPTDTPIPTCTPIPTVTPVPTPEYTEQYKAFREKAGSELVLDDGKKVNVEITDGITTYQCNTIALFDDSEVMCVIEGVRTYDPMSSKRFVIVDFSFMNLSDADFECRDSYLRLSDAIRYTYDPVIFTGDDIFAPVGNINQIAKPGDIIRAEVAFDVRYKSSNKLILNCDIPGDKIGRASFNIDLSKAVNQNGIQSSTIR